MTPTLAVGNTAAPQDGPLPKLSVLSERFMRYLQNPVWNFLCDQNFRSRINPKRDVHMHPSTARRTWLFGHLLAVVNRGLARSTPER